VGTISCKTHLLYMGVAVQYLCFYSLVSLHTILIWLQIKVGVTHENKSTNNELVGVALPKLAKCNGHELVHTYRLTNGLGCMETDRQ